MKNNLQWFESPKPTSCIFSQTNQHVEQFTDIPQIIVNNPTPTPIARHPLSPFLPVHGHERHISLKNQIDETKNRGINHLVVFSEDQDEELMLSPSAQRKTKKNEELLTTGRKSNIQKGVLQKKTRPKDKGLRGLSIKALNTVLQMKQGTYKQVANRLLSNFSQENEANRPSNEETNIKRRVYDALNVLISLGLLKKQGRMIVGQRLPPDRQKEQKKQLNHLEQRLKAKQFILSQKRLKLIQAKQKYKGIDNLLKNNIKNYAVVKTNQRYLQFPFVGVVITNQLWRLSRKQNEIEIYFKELVHPFGDLDCLIQVLKHFK